MTWRMILLLGGVLILHSNCALAIYNPSDSILQSYEKLKDDVAQMMGGNEFKDVVRTQFFDGFYFTCKNSIKIPGPLRCNGGNPDCADGSDEIGCGPDFECCPNW